MINQRLGMQTKIIQICLEGLFLIRTNINTIFLNKIAELMVYLKLLPYLIL